MEHCQVEIWSRAWLQDGNEVTIHCPNKPVVKKRHSRSVEHAEKKSHKKQNHHNLSKVEHLFSKFQVKYKRRYHTTMERQMRLRIFRQNLKIIQDLNENERGASLMKHNSSPPMPINLMLSFRQCQIRYYRICRFNQQ